MRCGINTITNYVKKWILIPLFMIMAFGTVTPAIAITYTSSWSGFIFAFEAQIASFEKIALAPVNIDTVINVVQPLLLDDWGVPADATIVTALCPLGDSIFEVLVDDPVDNLNCNVGDNFEKWDGGQTKPVPEPGTIVLLGLGLIGLVGVRGVRKR